ncbi:hypothetical protein [Ktedonobacter racemifer]|nr:hypothetical protein [Ktedonobacter racemifer]
MGDVPSANEKDEAEYDGSYRICHLLSYHLMTASRISPLDAQVVRALVESMDAGVPGRGLVSLPERLIQINEWLDTYQITLAL